MKRKLQVVYVAIEVTIAGPKHCSNDCDWMMGTANGNVSCTLFHELIEWDRRKKYDGYKRTDGCKAEQLGDK